MSGARILIIEDDAISGRYLQKTLLDHGYTVPAVLMSGEELMENIHLLNPDCILMDVKLQGTSDGIETAMDIQSRYDIPVIYMTAHIDPQTVGRAKLTNPYGYLVKPVNINELMIAIDFTLYRHHMEKLLKKSKERYRGVVDSMPLMICRFLPGDGVITFVNDEYCRYFSIRREELIGTSYRERLPVEERKKIEKRLLTLSRERPMLTYEHGNSGPSGHQWQHWTMQALFDEHGTLVEYQAIGNDITESVHAKEAARTSEEKFFKAFHSNPAGMAIAVMNGGRFIDVNASFVRLMGFERDELLGGAIVMTGMYADPGIAGSLAGMIEADGKVRDHEVRMKTKSGDVRTIRLSAETLELGGERCILSVLNDMTDRKEMEDSLREAHRRLSEIIDFLPDATFVIDREKRVIAWNRAMEKMTGVQKSNMLGRGDYEYAIPFFGERRPMLIDIVGEGSSRYQEKYLAFTKEGDSLIAESYIPAMPFTMKEMYLWGKASPLYDGDGAIIGGIEVTRDVTDIKRIEMALRESEEKFRHLFEGSADAQLLIDENLIIDCNMAAVNLFSAGKKEMLLGKSPQSLSPELMPDGTPSEARMNEILRFVFEMDSLSFEWVHLCLDGRQAPVDITFTVVPIAGKQLIHAVLKDITLRKLAQEALKKSEERYRVLVETMSDGLVMGDAAGTVTFVNDRFCEMVGNAKDEIMGKSILDLLSEDDRENFMGSIRGGRIMRKSAFEIKLRSRAVSKIDAIVSLRPIVDDRNNLAGIVAVFTDITERKYLERQVLEASMKEQQRIGRDLHDDLGQILTGTGFLCESLVRKLSNKALPEAEDARGVFALINEAKDHTRLLSRGLSPVEIDSGGIIAALERFARIVEGIYSVSFTLDCDPSIIINDSMVETQFHYIVQESVTNAIKHGKAGSIVVSLKKIRGKIRLSITDDGSGIPADVDTTKGMGLRIMQYRANAIGASIKIAKKRGGGTMVTCIWR